MIKFRKTTELLLTLSFGLMVLILSGCPPLKMIANSAPAAVPPVINQQAGGPTTVRCWESSVHCYIPTSSANEGDTNADYQASWEVSYNVLNAFSVDDDSSAITLTEVSAPPANRTYYAVKDSSGPANGRAKLVLTLFPKRQPDSRAHAETSVFHLKEHSPNSNFHGTPQENASTDLQLTYVTPGRCQIIDLSAPASVTKGDNVSVSWNIVNCKFMSLFRTFIPSSGGVLNNGNGFVAQPDLDLASLQTEENFNASRTFQTTLAGTDTYRVIAKNALGSTVERTLRVSVNPPGVSGGSGTTAGSTCASPTSFPMCTSCPGLYGAGPIESESQALACTEDAAKSAMELSNPGCSVKASGFLNFDFCVTCPSGDKISESVSACTEAGGNQGAARRHSSDCQVQTGACR